MASTYIHIGDIDKIPDDAPPALHFLKSYVPALDGPSHAHRTAHFSPNATVKTNADAPVPFSSLAPMFDMRAKIALRFWHVANRVWVVTEENVLMDWTSTTIFKEAEDKPAVVPEFTVMKLGKANEGEGVNGLWVESIENWMDASPVKEAMARLHEQVPKKEEGA
ncbi:hypothetical protein BU26DRAFT_126769 [Trematosphaeria pertusa]|uniref:Uncharacterized protein n=1 Tax=Trematosphaeria pertusa TaxID=390896 RepID=A0A6A6HZD0_9PLEO|nr:uncharacterized protein BU26DRAFT_126769 [Trematosphaeria pertusa]KAF2243128.1 hypothetical protein BU26DRAFT_126769 [Trematosphaeria pertusa]